MLQNTDNTQLPTNLRTMPRRLLYALNHTLLATYETAEDFRCIMHCMVSHQPLDRQIE